MADTKELETTDIPKKFKWLAKKKQIAFMDAFLQPSSKTFGNAYQSALSVGYSHHYAKHMLSFKQAWIAEYMNRIEYDSANIKMGIQELSKDAPNSRSPDDTRLKAYELLGKIHGMIDKQGAVNFTLVQPILGGISTNKPTKATRKQVEVEQSDPGP